MGTIINFLLGLLNLFFDKTPKHDVIEHTTPAATKDAFRDKVRKTWGKGACVLLALGALVVLGGCALPFCSTKTVYVPAGEIVRLREDVTAKVWVQGKDGQPIPSEMTLKDGWYCGSIEK